MKASVIALVMLIIIVGSNGYLCYVNTSLQRNISKLTDDLLDLEEANTNLLDNYSSLINSFNSLSANYSIILSEKLMLSRLLENVTTQKDLLIQNYTALLEDYDSLSENLSLAHEQIEYLNNTIEQLETQISKLKNSSNLTYFKNLSELNDWLAQDNTSDYTWVEESFDCDDFAEALMISAFKSGYKIETTNVYYTQNLTYIYANGTYYWGVPRTFWVETAGYDYHVFGNHMVNLAYVEDTGWVLIEPQTDEIFILNTHEL